MRAFPDIELCLVQGTNPKAGSLKRDFGSLRSKVQRPQVGMYPALIVPGIMLHNGITISRRDGDVNSRTYAKLYPSYSYQSNSNNQNQHILLRFLK